MRNDLSIALIGTRGVPARYGGFETALEEIGTRLAERGHAIRVYTRTGNTPEPVREHQGMQVVTLPAMRRRSVETLSHTALSVAHLARHRCDVAFVFNAANAPLLPVIRARRIPVATHVDGLEWRRAKWGRSGKAFYRRAESMAVRWSDALIADARGIADYYQEAFDAETELIAYGAPIAETSDFDRLAEHSLNQHGYHLVVARFEPENHIDRIVAGYVASAARLPLIVVGSAPYADDYTKQVHAIAARDDRVRFLGGVWDQALLDQLYGGALTYLHGHSVGGTNPSLLRAIGARAPTIAFEVSFNREVLGDDGRYFVAGDDVAELVVAAENDVDGCIRRGEALRQRASAYDWDDVADRYEDLARRLQRRETVGPQRARRSPTQHDL